MFNNVSSLDTCPAHYIEIIIPMSTSDKMLTLAAIILNLGLTVALCKLSRWRIGIEREAIKVLTVAKIVLASERALERSPTS